MELSSLLKESTRWRGRQLIFIGKDTRGVAVTFGESGPFRSLPVKDMEGHRSSQQTVGPKGQLSKSAPTSARKRASKLAPTSARKRGGASYVQGIFLSMDEALCSRNAGRVVF